MSNHQDELLAAAKRGDRPALCRLLEENAPALRQRLGTKIDRAFQSLISDDDILQVTFLEAFLRIHAFEPTGPGSFLAWLTQIAENNLRDAVRELTADKRPDPRRCVPAQGDESAVALFNHLSATTRSPSSKVAMQEALRLLDFAVRRLPADYRQVVEWYDLQGQRAEEIAARLGRTPGAVHTLRARAHDRLREILPSASKILGVSA